MEKSGITTKKAKKKQKQSSPSSVRTGDFFVCISSTDRYFFLPVTMGKNTCHDCVYPLFYPLMVFETDGSITTRKRRETQKKPEAARLNGKNSRKAKNKKQKKTNKKRRTIKMARMTATQAVEAIRGLTAEEEIKAVLMNCTKAVMCEVHEELVKEDYSWKMEKERMARFIAGRIERAFRKSAFRALTAKEQVAELVKAGKKNLWGTLFFCENEQEINRIAVELDINTENLCPETVKAIVERIRAMQSK